MPCLSAAATTSSSRMLPPGCTTAVAPAAAHTSRPSGNGKNASEATHGSLRGRAVRLGAHHCQARRIDAAHLPRADADQRVLSRQHDRVRLHVLADLPGEIERAKLGLRRRTLRQHPARAHVERAEIAVLHEHAADHLLHVEAVRPILGERHLQQPHVLLRREDLLGLGAERRRDHDLEEDVLHRFGSLAVDSRLVPTMPPKIDTGSQARPLRNASASEIDAVATPHGLLCLIATATVAAKLVHQLERGVGVDDVVERELLALELCRLGDGGLGPRSPASDRTRLPGAGSRRSADPAP